LKKIEKGDKNMNIGMRIILAVYAFCIAVISLASMLAAINRNLFEMLYNYTVTYVFSGNGFMPRLVAILVTLLFFVLSLLFIYEAVKSNRDKRGISKQTGIGEFNISLNSIESIALAAARKIEGIKEAKIFVGDLNDSVAIKARLIVFPDTNIPFIVNELQNAIKNTVEENAGIEVANVTVVVDSVFDISQVSNQRARELPAPPVKPRVE